MRSEHRRQIAARRRHTKRARHEYERKLVRKLYHMAEKVRLGHYAGVKDSPLLILNWDRVLAWIT